MLFQFHSLPIRNVRNPIVGSFYSQLWVSLERITKRTLTGSCWSTMYYFLSLINSSSSLRNCLSQLHQLGVLYYGSWDKVGETNQFQHPILNKFVFNFFFDRRRVISKTVMKLFFFVKIGACSRKFTTWSLYRENLF